MNPWASPARKRRTTPSTATTRGCTTTATWCAPCASGSTKRGCDTRGAVDVCRHLKVRSMRRCQEKVIERDQAKDGDQQAPAKGAPCVGRQVFRHHERLLGMMSLSGAVLAA